MLRQHKNCHSRISRVRSAMPWVLTPVFVGCLVFGGVAGNASANEGFESIFDGETLDGWTGEEGRWRVEDGHIIGETTEEDPLEENTFLIWEGGEPSDFELKFRFRIDSEWGNSGIQLRSERLHDHVVAGYQPDIATDDGLTGISYEERGRGVLARRGERTIIDEEGDRETQTFADEDDLGEYINPHEWTECHIIAEGDRITTIINGHVTSEIVDRGPEARSEGIIAFQLHSGDPMKIRFDDVKLKSLYRPLFDGETLDGWDGDPDLWRVEDGHLIGETTEEGQLDHNTFLIWDEDEPADFDLKFRYRIDTEWANSGVQVRSERLDGYRVEGYQADIATDDWITGIHYEEGGRGILARRGQSVTFDSDGERTVEEFADEDELFEHIHMDDWNDYRVRAVGNRIVTAINGVKMHEIIDDAPEARRSGVIAFQLHVGPAMRIRFDDIKLRETFTPIFDGESLEGWDGETGREEDVEPLESHAWEDRPVVIFAPSREDAAYQQQMESFEEHADGLDERDIALYRVFETGPPLGPEGPRSSAVAEALRERFDPEASFQVILVGKDTTEKLRRDDVLSAEELFETIDAMPMRRREMQRQNQ